MAIATVSPNQAIDFDSLDLSDGTTTTHTSTTIRRTVVAPGDYHQFLGSGFTYDGALHITGGKLTSITDVVGGTTHFTVTGASVPGTTLQGYFDSHDTASFLATLFAGNDSLTGANLDDNFAGFAGNDTLNGGPGADSMQGNTGNDTYIVDNALDRVDETGGDGTDTVQSSIAFDLTENGTTVLGEIENLTLTGTAGIAGTGNELDNRIIGNSGNNSLVGGDGNDTLDGGPGADTLDGGKGNDSYVVDNAKDVIIENGPLSDIDTVLSSITFDLKSNSNLENLTLIGAAAINGFGNSSDNYLVGNAAANTLDGRIGNDTMEGKGGNDSYIVDSQDDLIIEQAGGGFDIVTSSVTFDLSTNGANVEVLDLSGTKNGDATGNVLDNLLLGDETDNTLDGRAGKDTMVGGAGNDRYIVDNAGDVVDELISDGKGGTVDAGDPGDTVRSFITFSLVADGKTVLGNLENLELQGTANINGTGNALDNVIKGNVGSNVLDGRAGADTMSGGQGNDTYVVDDKGDQVTETLTLAQNGGIDTVQSSVSFAFAVGDNLDNLILTGTNAIDGTGNELGNTITGNGADNRLIGGDGNDVLNGGLGNDTLDGGTGDDTMTGGAGNDVYVIDSLNDKVVELANGGIDEIQTRFQLTNAIANIENYAFTGPDPVNFTGSDVANRITGTAEADTLFGGKGDDTLDGGAGVDSLVGGSGNDTYILDNPNDLFSETGNDKSDTVAAPFDIDLNQKNPDNSLRYAGIENATLLGTTGLTATGNAGNNILTGTDGVLATDGKDTLLGNGGNDTLIGNGGNDLLNGGAGDDSMAGGLGDDAYVVDSKNDKITEAKNAGIDTVISSIDYTLGANLEGLVLTGTANLRGTGNELANALFGNAGDNTLDGKAGADFMQGGAGNDTYMVDNTNDVVDETSKDGGSGVDIVLSSATFALGEGVENLTLTGTANIDGTGNNLANVLTGNSGNNRLDGGAGADTMIGGLGDDTYVVDATDGTHLLDVIVDTGGNDEVQTDLTPDELSKATHGLLPNIENYTFTGNVAVDFTGDSNDNRITGTKLDDTLSGGAGNDTLDGNVGADSLSGGLGNDTYVVDNKNDVVHEDAGAGTGTDTILFMGDDVFTTISLADYANIENLTLGGFFPIDGWGDDHNNLIIGSIRENLINGGGGNDTIFSGDGSDTIDGGAGADSMIGSFGDDTYYVDDKNDKVIEHPGGGIDTVIVTAAMSYTLAADLENLTLTGSADVNATGNAAFNILTGNDGNNVLDGKAFADQMIGGLGNDTYMVDNIGDVVVENKGEGIDTVIASSTTSAFKQYALVDNVENLTLTGNFLVTGIGNGLDNVITGNNLANKLQGDSGNDALNGGKGNDSLDGGFGNDTLDGGVGVDSMNGGFGDDTYVVDSAKDVVTEFGGDGNDTVKASISFSLTPYDNPISSLGVIENLTLTGTGAISGTGNKLNNVITGNNGANTLTGNDGDDTINGGAGNDTVIGGKGDDQIDVSSGNDTVRYTGTLDGHDVILGFDGNPSGGQDVINLDALFDSAKIATADRIGRVETAAGAQLGSIDVTIDVSAAHDHTSVVTLTVFTTESALSVGQAGQDVVVGTG